MTLMERSIVSLMVDVPSGTDLARALRPRFARLLRLDYSGWMRQLAEDGFSDSDISRLEEFIGNSFNETELSEKLTLILREVHDLNGEAEVDSALDRWLTCAGWTDIWEQVSKAEFPDPIDAAGYTGTCLLNIAASTLAFESLRRNPIVQADDWSMEESEMKEGIELAETGLTEDATEWTPY